jgi:ribose/xylose/arabinose/galactoside ABC-type transport system permease subunit
VTAIVTPLGRRVGRARVRQTVASAAGLVLVLVIAALFARDFYTSANLVLVAQQIGFIGVAAIGQTFILLLGGIDLSVGAVSGLTMVVLAVVSGGSNGRLAIAILLAFALGLAVGIGNAILVTWRNAPPFVATFATFTLVEGALIAWTKGAPSGNIPGALGTFGAGSLAGIPVPLVVFAGFFLASAFVLAKTTYGRRIYATGSNATAARLTGVPTRTIAVSVYLISALCAVVAGLLISGYIGYVDNQLIGSINLNCIAAAVIGGTTFAGGEGGAGRTTLGVVLLACVLSLMVFFNTGISGQLILEGAVILGAVWLQNRGQAGSILFRRRPPRAEQQPGA